MLCILRVKAQKSELSALRKAVAITPYRVDEDVRGFPEAGYLHYDVMEKEISFRQGLKDVLSFFRRNNNDIALLASLEENELELDVGINILKDEYSKNLGFNLEFMEILLKHRISLTLSLYQTSQSDEDVDQSPPHS